MKKDEETELEREMREMYEAGMASRPGPGGPLFQGPAREFMKQRARQQAAPKRQVTARFDQDVVERFKSLAGEGSYQRLMNQALREWLERKEMDSPLRRLERLAERLEKAAS